MTDTKITKSLETLAEAMCMSNIDKTKIVKTFSILGLPFQSIQRSFESVTPRSRSETTNNRDTQRTRTRDLEESFSGCENCFYLKKTIELEEEMSRFRLDLYKLRETVRTITEEELRYRSSPTQVKREY